MLEAGEVAGDYSQDWKSENAVSASIFFRPLIIASKSFFLSVSKERLGTPKAVTAKREQRRCSVLFTFVRVEVRF